MFNLTHPQKRIIVNQQIFPDSKFAYMYGSVEIDHQTTLRLSNAINAAIAFFDCLRIRFMQAESQIFQDISDFKHEEIESKPSDFDFFSERLHLFGEKLYRFYIVEESGKPSGYFFILHHAIVDAYTVTLITQYIADYLNGNVTDRRPRPFHIFIKSEQEYLLREACKTDKDFFAQRLQSSLNFKYVPEIDLRCDRMERGLSGDQSEAVLSFCRQRKISVFKLFYAALFLLLYAKNGKTVQTISTTHHNRSTEELLETGGMCASTIPVVQEIEDSLTCGEFIEMVSVNLTESIKRHMFPINLLLTGGKREELFDLDMTEVMLSSIPFSEGNNMHRFSPGEDISCLNFKLNPNSRPKGSAIELALDFRISRYTQLQAHQMLDRLVDIVFMCINRSDAVIFETLPMPGDIMTGIEQVMIKNPEKTALTDGLTTFTYRQLGQQVDAVAAAVLRSGQVVGIINKRSVWYVVAMLGILKAGKAFTPLDLELPEQRLVSMIKQTRMNTALIFTDGECDVKGVKTIDIRLLKPVETKLPVHVGGLAYILFTSGSTGTPKGVMVGRQGLFSLLKSLKARCKMNSGERFSAYCDFNFDVSILEILLPLFTASTLFIINEKQRFDLKQLDTFMRTNQIDHAFLPTKVGESFIKNFPDCPIKSLLIAGEKMNDYRKTKYQVYNGYGPTEFTILSHVERIAGVGEQYSIGPPLDGVDDLIVDSSGKPSGKGELVLIGEQVAFGYLNDYGLTTKHFFKVIAPDGSAYRNAYKTSDLVERDQNGNIYFLSRMDRQIKYNGYRIELGEIENVAKDSKLVEDSVCTFDGNRIILTVIRNKNYSDAVLSRFLSDRLAHYARPHHIISVNEFPKTKAGKIDYEACAKGIASASASERATKESTFLSLTQSEKKLLKIFSRYVSGSWKMIGSSENIFDMGIHSLDILQIMLEIEGKFKYPMRFSDFLLYPTIRELAALMETSQGQECVVKLCEGVGTPLVLIFDLSRGIIAYRPLLGALPKGSLVYGIDSDFIPQKFSLEEYAHFLTGKLFEKIEADRYDLVGYSSGGTVALEMAGQLGEKAGHTFLIDTPNYKIYPKRMNHSFIFQNVPVILTLYHGKGIFVFMRKLLRDLTQKRSPISEWSKLIKMIRGYEPKAPDSPVTLFVASETASQTDNRLGWQSLFSDDRIVRLSGGHVSLMKNEAPKIAEIMKQRRR